MPEKHGHTQRGFSPEYYSWSSMKTRCYNPNSKTYSYYGGRGITVCDRWRNSFVAFLADMGPRPSKQHSLERVDNNKGYEPSNCRWATRREQARNARSTRLITFDGRTMCLQAWADEIGVDQSVMVRRLANWPLARALCEPSNAT